MPQANFTKEPKPIERQWAHSTCMRECTVSVEVGFIHLAPINL